MQKLQSEGLFKFKNLPKKQLKKEVYKLKPIGQLSAPNKFKPADAAYADSNHLKSFIEQTEDQSIPAVLPSSLPKVKLNSVSTAAEDFIGSRTTKDSITIVQSMNQVSPNKQSSLGSF